MTIPCRKGLRHAQALRIIAFVEGEGGATTVTNRDLMRRLSMTFKQFYKARRHTFTCPHLDSMLAYRRGGRPLALVSGVPGLGDPSGRYSSVDWGILLRQAIHEIEQHSMVAIFERAAEDAFANGHQQVGRLFTKASVEVDLTGRISEPTKAALEAAIEAIA